MALSEFLVTYWYLSAAVVVTGVLFFRNLFDLSKEGAVSIFDATAMINKNHALVIDTRSAEEFDTGYIAGSINIPADMIQEKKEMLVKKAKNRPIITVCETGIRSAKAKAALIKMLEKNEVYNLEGGLVQWRKENMPLKMPQQKVSA